MRRSIFTLFAVRPPWRHPPIVQSPIPSSGADTRAHVHANTEPRAQHRPVCDVHAVWLHAGEAVPATADKISVPLVRRAPWGGDVRLCTGHAPEGWVRLGALDGALPPLAASNGSLFALGAVEEEEEEGKRVDLTEGTREAAPDRARSAVLRAPLHVSLLPAAWAEPARDPALRGRACVSRHWGTWELGSVGRATDGVRTHVPVSALRRPSRT